MRLCMGEESRVGGSKSISEEDSEECLLELENTTNQTKPEIEGETHNSGHTGEEKLLLVYYSKRKGIEAAAQYFNIPEELIQQYVGIFDTQGVEGLNQEFPNNNIISTQNSIHRRRVGRKEKEEIVEFVCGGGDKWEAAQKYSIPIGNIDRYVRELKGGRKYVETQSLPSSLHRFLPLIYAQMKRINEEFIFSLQETQFVPPEHDLRPIFPQIREEPEEFRESLSLHTSYSQFKGLRYMRNLHKLFTPDEKLAVVDLAKYGLGEEVKRCFKVDLSTIEEWGEQYACYMRGINNGNIDTSGIKSNISKYMREYGLRYILTEIVKWIGKNAEESSTEHLNLVAQIPGILGSPLPEELKPIQAKLWMTNRSISDLPVEEKLVVVKHCRTGAMKDLCVYLNNTYEKLYYWYNKYRQNGETGFLAGGSGAQGQDPGGFRDYIVQGGESLSYDLPTENCNYEADYGNTMIENPLEQTGEEYWNDQGNQNNQSNKMVREIIEYLLANDIESTLQKFGISTQVLHLFCKNYMRNTLKVNRQIKAYLKMKTPMQNNLPEISDNNICPSGITADDALSEYLIQN